MTEVTDIGPGPPPRLPPATFEEAIDRCRDEIRLLEGDPDYVRMHSAETIATLYRIALILALGSRPARATAKPSRAKAAPSRKAAARKPSQARTKPSTSRRKR